MHASCREFLDACAAQQVRLHAAIESTFRDPIRAARSSDTYLSQLMAAVGKAAWIAETTDEPIADRPVDLERLPPDPTMHMLASIANAALLPRVQPKPFENIRPWIAQQVCRDTENHWSEIFSRIARKVEKPGIEIFTEGDVIVALRKVKGNANGLLLQPRRLGQLDYIFPSGTILQLETSNEPSPLQKEYIRMPHGLKCTDWSLVTHLNPSRPSMYAIPREYRATHFGTHWRVRRSISMERIHQLAGEALARRALLDNRA